MSPVLQHANPTEGTNTYVNKVYVSIKYHPSILVKHLDSRARPRLRDRVIPDSASITLEAVSIPENI